MNKVHPVALAWVAGCPGLAWWFTAQSQAWKHWVEQTEAAAHARPGHRTDLNTGWSKESSSPWPYMRPGQITIVRSLPRRCDRMSSCSTCTQTSGVHALPCVNAVSQCVIPAGVWGGTAGALRTHVCFCSATRAQAWCALGKAPPSE